MIYNKNDVYIGKSLEIYGEFSFGEAELFEQIVREGMHVVEIGVAGGDHRRPEHEGEPHREGQAEKREGGPSAHSPGL